MPQETSRFTRAIKIKNPDDENQYVALKIIDEISFRDRRFQEYVYTFNNNAAAARQVRVEEIGESRLRVERIEKLSNRDDRNRFQEYIWEYLTEEPPQHLVTHDVTIYATDDNGNRNEDVWVKVRRVDKLFVLDEKERFQETELELDWPADEDYDYTGLGELYDQDPPYRIDPFQAIIDASWGGRYMMVVYGAESINVAAIPMSAIAAPTETAYSKELVESSGLVFSNWVQLKLGANDAFIASLIRTDAQTDTNTGETYYTLTTPTAPAPVFFNYAVCRSSDTIHKSALGSNSGVTLLNGSSSSLWASNGDQFTFSESGVTRTSAGEDRYDGAWVDSSGERHGLPVSGRISSGSAIISAAGAAALGAAFPTPAPGTFRALLGYVETPAGSLEADSVIGTIGPADGGGGSLQEAAGSVTVTGKLALLSQNGSVDVLSAEEVTAASSVDFYSIDPSDPGAEVYTTNTVSGSVGLFSYSFTRTESSIDGVSETGELTSFRVEAFPLGVNGAYYVGETNETAGTSTTHTPYGALSGSFDGGWFHASNGAHIMQGFYLDGNRKIYLDGVEYQDTLTGLLGTTVDDIYAIFLDIKLSDITSLR